MTPRELNVGLTAIWDFVEGCGSHEPDVARIQKSHHIGKLTAPPNPLSRDFLVDTKHKFPFSRRRFGTRLMKENGNCIRQLTTVYGGNGGIRRHAFVLLPIEMCSFAFRATTSLCSLTVPIAIDIVVNSVRSVCKSSWQEVVVSVICATLLNIRQINDIESARIWMKAKRVTLHLHVAPWRRMGCTTTACCCVYPIAFHRVMPLQLLSKHWKFAVACKSICK